MFVLSISGVLMVIECNDMLSKKFKLIHSVISYIHLFYMHYHFLYYYISSNLYIKMFFLNVSWTQKIKFDLCLDVSFIQLQGFVLCFVGNRILKKVPLSLKVFLCFSFHTKRNFMRRVTCVRSMEAVTEIIQFIIYLTLRMCTISRYPWWR